MDEFFIDFSEELSPREFAFASYDRWWECEARRRAEDWWSQSAKYVLLALARAGMPPGFLGMYARDLRALVMPSPNNILPLSQKSSHVPRGWGRPYFSRPRHVQDPMLLREKLWASPTYVDSVALPFPNADVFSIIWRHLRFAVDFCEVEVSGRILQQVLSVRRLTQWVRVGRVKEVVAFLLDQRPNLRRPRARKRESVRLSDIWLRALGWPISGREDDLARSFRLGDVVQSHCPHQYSDQRDWQLQAGETAIVVAVDGCGNLKMLNSMWAISGWLRSSSFSYAEDSAFDFDFWVNVVAPKVLSANLGPPGGSRVECRMELDRLQESYRQFSQMLAHLIRRERGAQTLTPGLLKAVCLGKRLDRVANRQALLHDWRQSARPDRSCFRKWGCPRQKCARKR